MTPCPKVDDFFYPSPVLAYCIDSQRGEMSIFMIKKQKMSVFAPRRPTSKLVIPKKLQDLFFNVVVFVKLYNSFLLLQKNDSHQKGGTALFFRVDILAHIQGTVNAMQTNNIIRVIARTVNYAKRIAHLGFSIDCRIHVIMQFCCLNCWHRRHLLHTDPDF